MAHRGARRRAVRAGRRTARVRGLRRFRDGQEVGREAPGRPVAENRHGTRHPERSASASRATSPSTSWCSAAATSAAPRPASRSSNWPTTSPGAPCCKASPSGRCWTPTARKPACSKFPPAAAATGRWNCWSSRSAWPRPRRSPASSASSGIAEEDSLAENVLRAPLHPLDQFRAFLALREKGQSEEEIAATFFVSAAVVKQRLRLASVSPALLDAYAEEV